MSLIGVAIKRPVFITMLTSFFIVVGVIALRALSVDLYPNINYPILVVRCDLPGAAPEEVEQIITKRVEDALSTVSGIQTIRSVSREGASNVILEFAPGIDVRFQEIQVRGKLANIRRSLPDDMAEPSIFRQDPDDAPIIEISVTGQRSVAEISVLADDVIARKIRQLSGVGEVGLNGERKPEIAVDLLPEALAAYRLNAKDVAVALKAASKNAPVGRIEGQRRVWVARAVAEAKDVAGLMDLPVGKAANGQPVFLRDVGTVKSGFEEVRRISRFGDAQGSTPAVRLDVLKQSGENTVVVSDRVRAALVDLQKELPPDVSARITSDNSDLVRDNVRDVGESLGLGAILTVIVVLLFLRSPRSTITTALSLPSSVITTFAVMYAAGFTVNVMTLLALSLAVGLLVDDAIVVRENIFRRLGLGESAKAAAHGGASEVALAVIATTLTIVAVFLPVGFMPGVSGQIFKQFALTVVFAMLVSLWDAMTMAPMLSAYFANIADPALEWAKLGPLGRGFDKLLIMFEHAFDKLAKGYGKVLGLLVPRPWIALAVAAVAMSGAVYGFGIVKRGFLPAQLGASFRAGMNGPLAVPMDAVLKVADAAEAKLRGIDALDNWTLSAGSGFAGNADISFSVRVKPEAATDQEALGKIRAGVRQALTGYPGYTTRISEPADPLAGGGGGRFQPIAVLVAGDEIDKIRDVARDARTLMMSVDGVTDVQPIQDEGLPELRFVTDPALAAQFGVTATQVGDTLSTWIQGDASLSIRVGDDQIPVRVRLAKAAKSPPRDLLAQNVYVRGSTAKADVALPLGAMVRLEPGAGPPVINRENRQRVVRIGGNLAPGAALGDIVTAVQARLDELPLPTGYSARIVGQNEQMAELSRNIVFAIAIGSLFVYMVLAALFESFVHPITVMAAIPLAGIGAVAGLLLFDAPLDLYAGVGIILLAGIVAKNSILLVDFAMQRVHAGEPPLKAILDSAPLRLRPILMTSIAMIAGMVPVAMGLGASGEARRGLGIATIGGVVSSTLLTLLVVPSLYLIVAKIARRTVIDHDLDGLPAQLQDPK